MNLKRLKEIVSKLEKIDNINDDTEIFIRNSYNPCGNIQGLEQVELSTYQTFGITENCIILNTSNSKELEVSNNEEYLDFIENI